MLIHLSSDRNYVRTGFKAVYSVTECPFNCSYKGECINGQCVCLPSYRGEFCEQDKCPLVNNIECGSNGNCHNESCVCDSGYVGYDCSLSLNTSTGFSQWRTVAPPNTGLQARVAHAGVYLVNHRKLWIFGGYTLQLVLDDLVVYDFAGGFWKTITKSVQWPRARYEHCMDGYGDLIFLYGGLLTDGSLSNELWMFNVELEIWSLKGDSSPVKPPGLSGATLTVVEDQWLYLFGGRTDDHYFSSKLYRIAADTVSNTWQKMVASGGKEAQIRSVGHSTVYHKESKSLVVYGGFVPNFARFPERTSQIHMFNVEDNYWSYINYTDQEPVPKRRAFHSAVIVGIYMMVFGGNIHEHAKEEKCFDDNFYYYHLGCHRWVNGTEMDNLFGGKETKFTKYLPARGAKTGTVIDNTCYNARFGLIWIKITDFFLLLTFTFLFRL